MKRKKKMGEIKKITENKNKMLDYAVNDLVNYCKLHPTCDKCIFRKELKGCLFRNKTPREW